MNPPPGPLSRGREGGRETTCDQSRKAPARMRPRPGGKRDLFQSLSVRITAGKPSATALNRQAATMSISVKDEGISLYASSLGEPTCGLPSLACVLRISHRTSTTSIGTAEPAATRSVDLTAFTCGASIIGWWLCCRAASAAQ